MNERQPFRSWVEDYVAPRAEVFDREAIAQAMGRRGSMRRFASIERSNHSANKGRLVMAAYDAQLRRIGSEVEQAKIHLQRRGLIVFRADVAGGPAARWDVSGQVHWLTTDELLALAAHHGFTPSTSKGNVDA